MHDLFTGWRRKIGVVTLVMALVFACGWIRSTSIGDMILLPSRTASDSRSLYVQVLSGHQVFGLMTTEAESGEYMPQLRLEWDAWQITEPPSKSAFEQLAIWDNALAVLWDRRLGGFRFARGEYLSYPQYLEMHGNIWIIPYWSTTSPLILISAFLLLSKPRPKKPPVQKVG